MPATLLERRLHFVVGKGGVGKTTVAAALALLLARSGRRTLAVEMEAGGRLARLLGAPDGGYAPREIFPGLNVLTVDGRAALEEYLGLIIPVKRLLSGVFSSKIYQYFVAAAPGLKELMSVGKIYYEATRREAGRPPWDAIVVDAPATGHSLQYLRMPQAARETFGAGLVQREATKITDLLSDPRTTVVHMVTVGEEMPVAETLETRAELLRLGLPLGLVIVNRLHGRRFPAATLAELRAATGVPAEQRPLVASVAEFAVEESGWAEINAQHIARLRAGIGDLPVIELPYLFAEEFDRREVERLSAALEIGLAARAERTGERRS